MAQWQGVMRILVHKIKDDATTLCGRRYSELMATDDISEVTCGLCRGAFLREKKQPKGVT